MPTSLIVTFGLLAAALSGAPAVTSPLNSSAATGGHGLGTGEPVRYAYTRVCSYGPRGWFLRNERGHIIGCRPPRPDGFDWSWRDEGGRSGWYDRRDRRWR